MRRRLLSFLLVLCMVLTLAPILSTHADAAPTVYKQKDSRWASYPYGYSDAAKTKQATIGSAGCGLLAYTNAVYYLNGSFIEPTFLADYSVKNGHRVNGTGTSFSLYKAFATDYGSKYGFKYVTSTSGYSNLQSYLKKGNVAICSKPGHIMAIVDYDSSNSKYLLLDSYPSSNRGTASTGYAWKTSSQLDSIELRSTFYILENTGKPPAPTIKSPTNVTSTSLTLNWSKVSNASSYRVDFRKTGDEYKTIKSGLTSTSYTISGLTPGTKYYARVYAVNSAGTSEKQGGYIVWTACDEVKITSAEATSPTAIKITWGAVTGAQSYRVDYRITDGEYSTVKTGLTTTSYTVSGLKPNSKYYFRVYAINDGGTSAKPGGYACWTLGNVGSGTVTLPASSYVYTGSAVNPVPTVKQGNVTLTAGTDYTVAYSNNVNVGTATVTVTGKGNYSGTKTANFTITAKSLADSSIHSGMDDDSDGRWGYLGYERTCDLYDGSTKLKEGTDYTVVYTNNLNAGGTATATFTGKGNYTGTHKSAISMVARTLTAETTFALSFDEAEYTGSEIKPKVTAVYDLHSDGVDTITLKEGTDYTLSYRDNVEPGTATVIVTGKGNYNGTKELTFTIKQTRTPLVITAQPKDYAGKFNSTASFSVSAEGDGLTYQWQISDDSGKTWSNSSVKNPKYSTRLTADKDGRMVRCIVTDQYGSSVTSDAAAMKIQKELSITTQPQNYVGKVNSTAKFTVKAVGDGLTYQWQISDNGGKTWKNSSVTKAVYSSKLTSDKDGRMVRCIITDQYGNITTSDAASMKISDLAITTQPKDYTGKVNSTAKFTVAAEGNSPSFQWQVSDDGGKTWTNSSVKDASYSTKLTAAKDGRMVRCIVTDASGAKLTSNAVSMKIG